MLNDVSQAPILDEPCIRGDASRGKRAHRSCEHRIRSALAEPAHPLAKQGVGQPYVHHRNCTYYQVVDQPCLLENIERQLGVVPIGVVAIFIGPIHQKAEAQLHAHGGKHGDRIGLEHGAGKRPMPPEDPFLDGLEDERHRRPANPIHPVGMVPGVELYRVGVIDNPKALVHDLAVEAFEAVSQDVVDAKAHDVVAPKRPSRRGKQHRTPLLGRPANHTAETFATTGQTGHDHLPHSLPLLRAAPQAR